VSGLNGGGVTARQGDPGRSSFTRQKSIVLESCGEIEPERIESYFAAGGYRALYESRAAAERPGPALPIRPKRDSGGIRRSSTMSRPSRSSRPSSATGPTGSPRSAPRKARVRRFSPWPAENDRRGDRRREYYDGHLQFANSDGEIVAHIDPAFYQEYIGEKVEPDSYVKSPYYKPLGPTQGICRVGPLARLNVCAHMGVSLDDQELKEFRYRFHGTATSSFLYQYARLIEILAAELAAAGTAVFVDARKCSASSQTGILVEPLLPRGQDWASLVHALTPSVLLKLCQAAFGNCPRAWQVSVPGSDFSFGEGLTELAVRCMEQALCMIETLLARIDHSEPDPALECLRRGSSHARLTSEDPENEQTYYPS
jgi:hypothetical protein